MGQLGKIKLRWFYGEIEVYWLYMVTLTVKVLILLRHFNHVVKMTAIRCLFAIVVKKGLGLYQLDVNNTLLHGNIDEVYMHFLAVMNPSSPPHVCQLKCDLYEL